MLNPNIGHKIEMILRPTYSSFSRLKKAMEFVNYSEKDKESNKRASVPDFKDDLARVRK